MQCSITGCEGLVKLWVLAVNYIFLRVVRGSSQKLESLPTSLTKGYCIAHVLVLRSVCVFEVFFYGNLLIVY